MWFLEMQDGEMVEMTGTCVKLGDTGTYTKFESTEVLRIQGQTVPAVLVMIGAEEKVFYAQDPSNESSLSAQEVFSEFQIVMNRTRTDDKSRVTILNGAGRRR